MSSWFIQVRNDSTPTSRTGPSVAASGQFFSYMESGSGAAGDRTDLIIKHPFKAGALFSTNILSTDVSAGGMTIIFDSQLEV